MEFQKERNYYTNDEELQNQYNDQTEFDRKIHSKIVFKNFENEEEDISENNEKEMKLNNLYEEEGFTKPNYYPTIQIVTPSEDSKYIEDINQKYEFTNLINALMTSK